ncbi:hypothetical protein CVIRNUC_008482 [Coccomyxa viridis]|uniref:VOC domain-containing protein n=1 Tax=Coccomyxa viridis TaxID=1274662 RepID=A0AAV1IEQ2_9CHLO|nr:hypothetical protein CVIRNUC_008482 [Coccomyxa viridis]
MSLPIQSISHLSRVVADVDTTAAFYIHVLGFAPIRRPSCLNCEGCWLVGHGVSLHLIKGTPVREARPINPSDDHTSFQSNSLPEVESTLQRHGIPFVKCQVVENGIRVTQIFIHDPDNNMIEVCDCDALPIEPIFMSGAQAAVQESCAHQNAVLSAAPRMEHSERRCAGMSPISRALRSEAA